MPFYDRAMAARTKTLIGIAVVAVLAIGLGLYWFLSDDAPEEVSLDRAIESVTGPEDGDAADGVPGGSSEDAAAPDDEAPPPDPVAGISGTWVVDTESGEFDFESATGSFVGFRVREELVGVGATEAVGRTGAVTGSLTIEGTTLTATTIEADMGSITTNEGRRDGRVREALETRLFPSATFTLTAPAELGPQAEAGERIEVTLQGDLTIHGVTRPVSMPVQAQLVDGTIVAVGSLEVTFADYGVSVPSAPVVVSAEDHGTVELQLLWVRS